MARQSMLHRIQRNLVSLIGGVGAFLLLGACLLAPLLAAYDPAKQDLGLGLIGPTVSHWLGTDQLGRDLLSRLLWAGRTSFTISAVALGLSLVIGLTVGLLAGYRGGWLDNLLMRVVDLFLSLPSLIVALAFVGAVGPGLAGLIPALVIGWWPFYARLVRSQVLALRGREFVTAARMTGCNHWHIVRCHLLPTLFGPLVVQLSLDVGHLMLTIAGLSFLGVGVQPPAPEWGTLLVDARPFMQVAPHLVIAPGIAILITVFGFNALAEGLERWLDPWA